MTRHTRHYTQHWERDAWTGRDVVIVRIFEKEEVRRATFPEASDAVTFMEMLRDRGFTEVMR